MYISGRNLATFTKWKGYDPETSPSALASSGTVKDARLANGQGPDQQSSNFYPLNTTIIMGVNISF